MTNEPRTLPYTLQDSVEYPYTVQDGRVITPGKFEGEQSYLPDFYGFMLDGGATEEYTDHHGIQVCIIDVSAGDVTSHPQLAGVTQVAFYEDDQGFVHECQVYTGSKEPVCPYCDRPLNGPGCGKAVG